MDKATRQGKEMSQEDVDQPQEPATNKSETFVYRFIQYGKEHVLKVPVPIPLETTVKELAYRIIGCHSIACYVEDGKRSHRGFSKFM